MGAKSRVLIPFDEGFVEVDAQRPEVGEKVVLLAMQNDKPFAVPIRPIAEGDTVITITTSDGTEASLKCTSVFFVSATTGKLKK